MRQADGSKSVQAEMQVLAKQVYLERGSKGNFQNALVFPLTMVPGPLRVYVGAFAGGLLLVFVLVLVIACTNAASLLLARATGRAREMATRSALGAGRARLVRQMLVESLLLAGIAGAAGVGIAWVTSRMLMVLKPGNIPVSLSIPMDWRVVLFTAAISVATGVVFGLAPALRASAVRAAVVLKDDSPAGSLKKSRLRSTLVVAQMAVCVVLLAGRRCVCAAF
jgi:putative ABC transport system permease protein